MKRGEAFRQADVQRGRSETLERKLTFAKSELAKARQELLKEEARAANVEADLRGEIAQFRRELQTACDAYYAARARSEELQRRIDVLLFENNHCRQRAQAAEQARATWWGRLFRGAA